MRVFLVISLSFFVTACQSSVYTFSSTPNVDAQYMITDHMYMISHGYLAKNPDRIKLVQQKFGSFDFENAADKERIQKVRDLNTKIQNVFTYKSDKKDATFNWDSDVESLLEKNRFSGDCEDLALTSLEVFIGVGFPEDRLYKIITASGEDKSNINHMVAGYLDDNGVMWIFGDTFNKYVKRAEHVRDIHHLNLYSRYDWEQKYNPAIYQIDTVQ